MIKRKTVCPNGENLEGPAEDEFSANLEFDFWCNIPVYSFINFVIITKKEIKEITFSGSIVNCSVDLYNMIFRCGDMNLGSEENRSRDLDPCYNHSFYLTIPYNNKMMYLFCTNHRLSILEQAFVTTLIKPVSFYFEARNKTTPPFLSLYNKEITSKNSFYVRIYGNHDLSKNTTLIIQRESSVFNDEIMFGDSLPWREYLCIDFDTLPKLYNNPIIKWIYIPKDIYYPSSRIFKKYTELSNTICELKIKAVLNELNGWSGVKLCDVNENIRKYKEEFEKDVFSDSNVLSVPTGDTMMRAEVCCIMEDEMYSVYVFYKNKTVERKLIDREKVNEYVSVMDAKTREIFV
jgi:hypothetical protein